MARTGPLGAPTTLDFGEWCATLASPAISAEKTAVGCWTPIDFAGDSRRKSDAQRVTCLVFDLDQHVHAADADADFARLSSSGLTWFAHTSHSHGEIRSGQPHVAWRLLVPLDCWLDRAPAETAAHFALRARHLSQWCVDRIGLRGVFALADTARIWYLPAVHPDRHQAWRTEGRWGNPICLAQAMADFREPKVEPFRKPPATPEGLDLDSVRRALDTLRDCWPGARAGYDRNYMRLALVGLLAMSGFDDDYIEQSVAHVYSLVGDDAAHKTATAIEHTRHQIDQGANVLTWGPIRSYFLFARLGYRLASIRSAFRPYDAHS